MAGFNVMDMLNKTSKEGIEEKPKARFRTKDIDIYNIYANEDNISDQIGIDEKAAEIKLLGLLQPRGEQQKKNEWTTTKKIYSKAKGPKKKGVRIGHNEIMHYWWEPVAIYHKQLLTNA